MPLNPDQFDQNCTEFLAIPGVLANQKIYMPQRDRSYTFQRNIEKENDNNVEV